MSINFKQSDIDEIMAFFREYGIKDATPITKEEEVAFANKKVDWTVEEAMAEFDELLFNELDAA